ncbi:signal recognition particle-docking protein FtsY, partial [Streptococcus sanguinis]|uniref:signal recognition particle-docking protein FtsY n=1 Tax=Streptococcus sanguinis TaxID=1305 RepID=UPI001CBF159D
GVTVRLFVGVNGVGKTTSIGKLAHKYKQEGKKVMLVAADTFRAGAVAQLAEWGRRVDVPVVTSPEKSDPASVVFDGMERAVAEQVDVLMIDTAGRLQIDEKLMQELSDVKALANPNEILLVVDAMIGQEAANVAREFNSQLEVTGVILTKIDGDTRGGAALSVRQITGKPIKFTGTGEKITDIETFHPDRMSSRILGMGDML